MRLVSQDAKRPWGLPGSPEHSPPDQLSALRKLAGATGRRDADPLCATHHTEVWRLGVYVQDSDASGLGRLEFTCTAPGQEDPQNTNRARSVVTEAMEANI